MQNDRLQFLKEFLKNFTAALIADRKWHRIFQEIWSEFSCILDGNEICHQNVECLEYLKNNSNWVSFVGVFLHPIVLIVWNQGTVELGNKELSGRPKIVP